MFDDDEPVPSARIFIATPVPTQVVQAVQAALPEYQPYTERVVEASRWHLTLLWLGEVENPKQYYSRLRKAIPQQFVPTVRLTHLGRGKRRSQLWAYAEASVNLQNIRTQIIDRLRRMRFPLPDAVLHRPFIPHIHVGDLYPIVLGIGLADYPLQTSFTIREAHAYRSHPSGQTVAANKTRLEEIAEYRRHGKQHSGSTARYEPRTVRHVPTYTIETTIPFTL